MNCLDFRRRLMTDPFDSDEALENHASDCAECAGFAREIRAQEIRMRSLLQDVSPPDGLAERIRMAARFDRGEQTRRRWWYAAAAAVFLSVAVSMVSVMNTAAERGQLALTQSVINHIEDEANHLREAHPVSAGRLNWVFRRFGAELVDNVGQVNFAAECLMREKNGIHLVLPGAVGPITVFFMPGERVAHNLPVESNRFEGEIVPTDWGSIAVVGEIGESIDGMGERLAGAVYWPTAPLATAGFPGIRGLGVALVAK